MKALLRLVGTTFCGLILAACSFWPVAVFQQPATGFTCTTYGYRGVDGHLYTWGPVCGPGHNVGAP